MGLFGWLANHWTPAYEYREYYGNEVEYIAWESTTVGSRRGFLLGLPAGALLTAAVIGGAVLTLYTPPAPTVVSRERQPEATASHATQDELRTLREENQGLKKLVLDVNRASQATTTALATLREENQGLKKQVTEVKATASQTTTKEVDALREENQGLKKQVMEVKSAASQATTKELDALREENQGLKKQVMEVKAAATCPPCQRQALTKAQPPAQAVAAPPQPSKQAMPRAAARRKASVTIREDQVASPIPSNCRQEGNCQ